MNLEVLLALKGTRVLLVEDEGVIVMLVGRMLESVGCTVVGVAARVNDALDKVANLVFDVALLDINLAGNVTYPVADALRARGVPFVFATGYGSAALKAELRGAPVLSKPYVLAQLIAALTKALEKPEVVVAA
jgi:CheY-like chemotaxis protein